MASNFAEKVVIFRLYDVNGSLLDNPNDFIEIREPEGFSAIKITLERDLESNGVFYEFASEETSLGFDRAMQITGQPYNPYEFLESLLGSDGVDAEVVLEVVTKDTITSVEAIQYRGNVDFETISIIDYKVDVLSRRITLGDLFRTRLKTKVNFGDTESIDGEPITGLNPYEMFLHSKLLKFDFFCDDIEEGIKNLPVAEFEQSNTGNPLYTNIGFINITKNAINTYNDPFLQLSEIPESTFTVDAGGLFIINRIQVNKLIGTSYGGDVSWGVYYRVSDGEEVLIGGAGGNNGPFVNNELFLNVSNLEIELPVLQAKAVNEVFIYVKIETQGIGGLVSIKDGGKDGLGIVFLLKNDFLDVSFKSVNEGSLCDVYNVFEATNHLLESITNKTNVLESSFLQNLASDIYQTNGYKIRKFEDNEVITSFYTQFNEWLQPNFGLGYTIYDDPNTSEPKLLIERYEEFYKESEIDYIDTIKDGSYEITIDKDLIFNEFEVGYESYPSSTDENTGNNIDEFNTIQSSLSPIKSVESKKSYLSKCIASGYKWENQRREQFKDVPSDTVSDDDKVFCVKGVSGGVYTLSGSFSPLINSIEFNSVDSEISINGTWFDIQEGDTVDIQRSFVGPVPQEGLYTVSDIKLLGDRTILTVLEVFTDNNFFDTWTIEVTSSSRLRASRNEEFSYLGGVISPDTVYNAGLNPKLMLLNHSLMINSGFHPKAGTEEINVRETKLNEELEYEFNAGEGLYNVDTTLRRVLKDNIELNDCNEYKKLFSGLVFKFEARISYERVLNIRDSYLNQKTLASENFGFIRFKDPFDQDRKGYLLNMTYNPFSEMVEFTLRGVFEPSGTSFQYVLDSLMN